MRPLLTMMLALTLAGIAAAADSAFNGTDPTSLVGVVKDLGGYGIVVLALVWVFRWAIPRFTETLDKQQAAFTAELDRQRNDFREEMKLQRESFERNIERLMEEKGP